MSAFDGFTDDADELRRKAQAGMALRFGTGENPDQVAQQTTLAKRFNLPLAVVQMSPDEFSNRAKFEDANAVVDQSPKLRDWLATDSSRAGVAHDSIKTLGAMEGITRQLTGSVRALAAGLATDFNAAAWAGAETGARLIGTDTLAGFFQEQRKGQEALGKRIQGDYGSGGTVESGVASGFRSFGAMIPATVASVLTGNPQFMLGMGSAQAGGQAMAKGNDAGLNPWQTLAYGAEDAVAEYATEMLPVGRLLKDLKAGAPFWKLLGMQMATEIPTELAATAWQNANEWMNVNPDKSFDDYLQELGPAEGQTVIATITQTVLSAGMAHGVTRIGQRMQRKQAEAQQGEATYTTLQQLGALAAAGPLRERSPEAFNSFVEQVTEDGQLQEVYIDGRTLVDALHQSGISDIELGTKLPAVAAQINEALESNGSVRISTADYLTQLAGSPADAAILPHLKTDPAGKTYAEAQEFYQSQATELQAEAGKIIAQRAEEDAFKADHQQVFDQVLGQLNAANRFTPDVNQAYATLARDYYVTTADKLGIKPSELLAQHPLNIAVERLTGGQFDQVSYNENYGFLPDDTPADRPLDAAALADLRSQAAGLERPRAGVMLRVTDDGHAIATGPKGTRIPETFVRFAEQNKLKFMARRRLPTATTALNSVTDFSEPMPIRYRAGGSLYFNEMGDAWLDRTDMTLFQGSEASVATLTGAEIAPLDADIKTLRAAARAWYDSRLRGSRVVNEKSGREIEFRGSRKTFSASADPDKLRLFAALPDVLQHGVLEESILPKDPGKEPSTKAWHWIAADVDVGGRVVRVGVTVREDANGHLYYNHTAIKGEGPADTRSDPALKAGAGESTEPYNQSIAPSDDDFNLHLLEQGNRGAYDPGTNTIALLKGADLSTFLHELGHHFLEMTADLASQPNAPAQVRDDFVKLLNWFGIGGTATPQGHIRLSPEDLQQGQTLRGMAERFGVTPRELVEQWKVKAPRSGTEQGALWTDMQGVPELALYVAENPGRTLVENYDKFPAEVARIDRTEIQNPIEVWHNLSFEEKRSYHEQFARGFESYLFEGNAPSVELQTLFGRFRAWLVNVYKSLASLNVELTDDVRGAMGRMIASEEAIRELEQVRGYDSLLKSAEAAGMTPEQYADYQKLGVEATENAIDTLQRRSLRDMRWLSGAKSRALKELQNEAASKRREVRTEVSAEVWSQPVYQAWQFLTARENVEKVEPAPKDKAPEGVDPSRDSMLVAIAKLDGIRKDQLVGEWGMDPKEKPDAGLFGKPVARAEGKGRSLDEMGMALAGYGYLAQDEHGKHDQREFEDKFFSELRGEAQYSNQADYDFLQNGPQGPTVASLQQRNGGRLDTEQVRANGAELAARIEALRMTRNGALHPDLVADMFGFTSGNELLHALADAQRPKDVIEGMTDQRMLERYGELSDPQAIERAAEAAIHNEARARFMATGLKVLTKSPLPARQIAKAAQAAAEAAVAAKKVRDLRPAQYTTAETRANKNALKAAATDPQAAAVEQRAALLNNRLAKAAANALEDVRRGVQYLKKFDGANIRNTLDADYADQIEALLERFDLRSGQSLRNIDKHKTLADWLTAQREMGLEPDIPQALENEAYREHYKNLTVEQFRGLLDTVKQIEHLGRLKHRLLTTADQRAYEAVRDEIAASIDANAQGRKADTRTPTTNTGRVLQGLKRFWAVHRKAAMLARTLDGEQDGGPMWEYFVRNANERGDMETTMRADATHQLTAILAPIFKLGKMGGAGIYFPALKRSLNREARLAIALNVGNEGNLQRLLGGEGWTARQLQPVLDTLTAEEWTAVQALWDHFESYRPQIGAKERRVYGKEPEWVAPGSELLTALAIKSQIPLRGGYYPIKYDPAASQRAEEHADAEGAKRQLQGAYTSATTRRSFTKARAEEVTGRPLLYSLAGLYSGVQDVIHDLAWHEWLIDTNRLMRSTTIDNAIREHYGPEVKSQFKDWIRDVAEGERGAANAGEAALSRLRQGVSAAGLGFNVMSALMQPLGITQSIVRVGAPWIGKGIARYVAHPIEATRQANDMSDFMTNRARTRLRELNELRNKVQDESDTRAAVNGGLYFLMMRFQQAVDVPTWWGAYEKAVAEGSADTRAVALADQAVIDSQGGGMLKDLSAVERGGPALKLFTVFYSFMNTAFNLGVNAAMSPAARAKKAADLILIGILPPMLALALKQAFTPGGGDDEWDLGKLAKKLVAAQIDYLMGLMVVAREFAEAGKTLTGANDHGRDYTGPAGLRLVSDTVALAKQAHQGEFDTAFRKAAINVVGDLFGLPAAQINRSITGTEALVEGETQNPAAVVFGYQKPR